MNKSFTFLLFAGLLFFSQLTAAAPIETFKFDSPATEKTFHKLSEELRCLVCQNQNIAESNADLAKDLRLEIYNMLIDGQSEEEIVDFMVQRYGDYVLYRPPFKPMTWLLWFGPILVFIFGLFFVVRLLKAQSSDEQPDSLSEEEVERIKNLHAEQDGK
jgi:cytochrome c-type biogenesis protein CcmH